MSGTVLRRDGPVNEHGGSTGRDGTPGCAEDDGHENRAARADNAPAGRTVVAMRPESPTPSEHDEATSGPSNAVRHLLAAALIVIAAACQLLPRGETLLGNGEVRRLPVSNPNLELPRSASIETVDGRMPLVLGRSVIPGGELVTVEHLEPGTYTVSWPGRGYGGTHFPAKASIVIVEAVDSAHMQKADPQRFLAVALLAVALLAALLAGRAALGSRRRLVLGGALVAILGVWGGSGWATPGLIPATSMVLAGSGIALVLAGRAREHSGTLLMAGVAVLLWPSMLVGIAAALASALAGVLPAVGPTGRGARRSLPTGVAFAAVLVAGAWVGNAGDVGNGIVRLGNVTDEGLDFAECAEREQSEKILGRECFRALGVRLGANLPPQEASRALLSGLESVGVRQDSQCRTAGGALSYGAARWGAGRNDPRALFVEIAPICDYSSMHGIVAGAFAHSGPERFSADVLLLCGPTSPDEDRLNSPEYSRQCWQAAGIAIGRRTRYADPTALLFCGQAAPYGMNNCTDGYFQELVDQKARAAIAPATRLHPEGVSVRSLCGSLPDELAGGCYRYVGEEAYYEGGTRREGLLELERVCTEDVPEGHRTPCWYALGMVSVRTLLYGNFDELAVPVNEICPNAPTEQTLLQCLHGGGNAIIGLLGADAPVERICAWFPETRREEYCGYTERYRDHLREGDPTN